MKVALRSSVGPSRGFTLLEVVLALALTAVVLSLVATAVRTTLRTVESGRQRTEREQLARAILHRIADDLRAVVRYEPFDESGLNSDIGGGLGGLASGATGGTGGQSSTQSGSNSGQNSSTAGGDNTSQNSADDPTGEMIEDTRVMAGVYGYPTEISLDITQIPRLDESLYADGVTTPLQRGDVRTVRYYLGLPQAAGTAGTTSVTTADQAALIANGGLVRSEMDRAASLWQLQSGTAQAMPNEVVLASEVVALQFRYFDGANWLTDWDSTLMNGIPRAVEISLWLSDPAIASQSPSVGGVSTAANVMMTDDPENYYRMVVHLPAGIPLPATDIGTGDESVQQDSSASGTSGSTSTSGTTTGGM